MVEAVATAAVGRQALAQIATMRMHRECLIAYPPFHVRLLANLPTALPDVLVSLQVNANDVHASADAQRKHNSALQYTDLRDQRIAVQKMIALRYTMSEEFDAFPMENLSST